jgi:tripartite-type tricarboxylate transporter receptor subunit TctC
LAGQPVRPAAAADAAGAAFYQGKTVTIIVATKPGGGYDTYARLFAKYMAKYLPGSTFIVRNVPGGGHIIGANETYNAKPDGLTLGTFNKGLILAQIVGTNGIKFDMAKFGWVGVPDSEPRVWIVSKQSPFMTFKDVLVGTRPLIQAANGVGTEDYEDEMLLQNIFHLKNLKIITGYHGGDIDLAMLRGDIEGKIGTLSSVRSLIENEGARILLVIGKTRLPDFPDAPALPQIAPADKLPLVNLMISQALLGHPFAVAPGVPADRLQALRQAFDQALRDPELQAMAKKEELVLNPIAGADVARLVAEASRQPPATVALVESILHAK